MHVETISDGHILLKLGRTFAVSDVERMLVMLESAGPSTEAIVDFTDVHEFQDAAFPVLFRAIAPLKGRIALRGLTDHHARMLKYLGLLD